MTMAGNAIGNHFRITTFGESHGRAIGAVIDGVRPGLPIDLAFIQHELERRRPGQSKLTTSRQETDQVEILSGVYEGRTTGTPICMIVWNKDQQPKAYEKLKDVFRPGHAGFTYLAKYGISDYRGEGDPPAVKPLRGLQRVPLLRTSLPGGGSRSSGTRWRQRESARKRSTAR